MGLSNRISCIKCGKRLCTFCKTGGKGLRTRTLGVGFLDAGFLGAGAAFLGVAFAAAFTGFLLEVFECVAVGLSLVIKSHTSEQTGEQNASPVAMLKSIKQMLSV
jgi:hypothetical protein